MTRDQQRLARSVALNAGTLIAAGGIACFDYRLGIIAVGGTIAAAALYGISKDARNTPGT
jgi:hypothetical protein